MTVITRMTSTAAAIASPRWRCQIGFLAVQSE